MAVKGKWARGITPRNFTWIIKDQLAICERPGGYGNNHRKVRRQEEIIWLREQEFTFVISVIVSPHNLHNYDELNVAWKHRPLAAYDDFSQYLSTFYPELHGMLTDGAKLIVHGEAVGDRLCGLMGGYLLWAGLIDSGPRAISATEHLTSRQLGPVGREIIAIAKTMPGPGLEKRTAMEAARAKEAAARAKAAEKAKAEAAQAAAKSAAAKSAVKRKTKSRTAKTSAGKPAKAGARQAATKKASTAKRASPKAATKSSTKSKATSSHSTARSKHSSGR
ncbi:MAG: hypothetical protein HYX32_10850 [Actinobacteria bacterium]|nr:hypothetical protein [Actinomycetota bacterium]